MTSASPLDNLRDALIAADIALHSARRELPALCTHRGFVALADALHHTCESLKALDRAASGLVLTQPYNTPGHVCPDTGRLAMTVADAYARDDYCDRHFWIFNKTASDLGIEPWHEVEGLDPTTATGRDGKPVGYTILFAGSGSRDVYPPSVVYMQRTAAERAA